MEEELKQEIKEETAKNIQKFDAFEVFYLIYLAAMPAVGTVFLLQRIYLPEWSRFWIFLLGVAAVGLYLATISSFTTIPKSWWKRLLFLLDGPLIAVGLVFYLNGSFIDLLMNMFFIDVGGAVLGIFITVIRKAPTKEDRIKGMIASGIPFLFMLGSLFLYSLKDPEFSWLQLGILLLGLGHTGFIQSHIFEDAKNVVRECLQIIILGVVLWLAGYIFGCVFWDIKRKEKAKDQESGVMIQKPGKQKQPNRLKSSLRL